MKQEQEVLEELQEEFQVVSFTVGDGEYAVNILEVQEINRLPCVTRIPGTPPYVKGVINLRGNVIPVIDLHQRLGIITGEATEKSRVIIVRVYDTTVGMIVDEVLEVLTLSQKIVEPPPSAGDGNSEFLRGVGKLDNRLLMLVDLEQMLGLSSLVNRA